MKTGWGNGCSAEDWGLGDVGALYCTGGGWIVGDICLVIDFLSD